MDTKNTLNLWNIYSMTTWINGKKIELHGCTKTVAGYYHPEHGKLDPIYIKNVREK
jgi:hypothetical protein